jgi:hypothetical protein
LDVVYHLRAFLAERVLDIIGTSRRRSGAFWTSWRTTWGGKAEDLTPKTKLQFYYEHDFVMAAAFEKAEHQSGR